MIIFCFSEFLCVFAFLKFLNQGLAACRPPTLQPEPMRGQRALFRTEAAPYKKRRSGLLARLKLTKKSTVTKIEPALRSIEFQAPSLVSRGTADRPPNPVPREASAKPRLGPPTR